MAGDGRSNGMGAGSSWAETSQPEVAQREIGFLSNTTTSCGCLKSEFAVCQGTAVPSQPGNCTRDRTLEGAEVGAGVVVDVRLPRSCHRRSEARVGEGLDCFQETSNRCRSRTMPQVHLKVREEGGRVGFGTFSLIQCSYRGEGSPTTFGGRTSSSNEPPGTINTFVSTSRVCRDCCFERQTRRSRRGERRCDPESVEQAAGDHVFCGNCKRRSADARDQSSQRVERVVAGVPRGVGQALAAGDETRVMELSSRLSDGAAKMSELMGVMVP